MIEANTDTRFQFIRECIEDGKVEVDHISTADQLADLHKGIGASKIHRSEESSSHGEGATSLGGALLA